MYLSIILETQKLVFNIGTVTAACTFLCVINWMIVYDYAFDYAFWELSLVKSDDFCKKLNVYDDVSGLIIMSPRVSNSISSIENDTFGS